MIPISGEVNGLEKSLDGLVPSVAGPFDAGYETVSLKVGLARHRSIGDGIDAMRPRSNAVVGDVVEEIGCFGVELCCPLWHQAGDREA